MLAIWLYGLVIGGLVYISARSQHQSTCCASCDYKWSRPRVTATSLFPSPHPQPFSSFLINGRSEQCRYLRPTRLRQSHLCGWCSYPRCRFIPSLPPQYVAYDAIFPRLRPRRGWRGGRVLVQLLIQLRNGWSQGTTRCGVCYGTEREIVPRPRQPAAGRAAGHGLDWRQQPAQGQGV